MLIHLHILITSPHSLYTSASPSNAPENSLLPDDAKESSDFSSVNRFWGGGKADTDAPYPVCVPSNDSTGGSGVDK